VAIASNRADCVAATILACHQAACEVVLLRGTPRNSEIFQSWGISALVDDELQMRTLSDRTVPTEGFRILVATSGTTGEPKLVRHKLEGLLGKIRPRPAYREPARWLLTYHPATFAGLQVLLTALVSGDELIAASDLSVKALVNSALEFLPTHISATPTFWRNLLVAAGSSLFRLPLVHLTLGGEVADQRTLDLLRVAFPASGITHIYATTEAGALFAVKDCRAGFPCEWLSPGIEGVGLRIVDGMLEIHSPYVMAGYFGRNAKNPFTADGWLQTGDIVRVEGDRVYFVGRADSVISVGGAKVIPEEVEGLLLQIPDVLDCRVFGVPNVITGCVVATEIVTPAQDLGRFRKAVTDRLMQTLERHKVPQIIHFVESLESSHSGKKKRFDGAT
jgi:acyl-CoA synthetase (AMP-forming)/AMP-acid ligase II